MLMRTIFQMVRVDADEAPQAQAALFSRHPEMATWPSDHDFEFWKLNIKHIFLLDFYGGAPDLTVCLFTFACDARIILTHCRCNRIHIFRVIVAQFQY